MRTVNSFFAAVEKSRKRRSSASSSAAGRRVRKGTRLRRGEGRVGRRQEAEGVDREEVEQGSEAVLENKGAAGR